MPCWLLSPSSLLCVAHLGASSPVCGLSSFCGTQGHDLQEFEVEAARDSKPLLKEQ